MVRRVDQRAVYCDGKEMRFLNHPAPGTALYFSGRYLYIERFAMKKMYTVCWEMQVFARSPREAAKQALEIQRDPDGTATVFTVHNNDRSKTIDLEE